MSGFLKINRDGPIREIAFDRSRANASDAHADRILGWRAGMAPWNYGTNELLLAGALYPDTPPYCIEGLNLHAFNQIESIEK